MANRSWTSEPGHREGHLTENVGGLVNPFWSQGVQQAAGGREKISYLATSSGNSWEPSSSAC